MNIFEEKLHIKTLERFLIQENAPGPEPKNVRKRGIAGKVFCTTTLTPVGILGVSGMMINIFCSKFIRNC